MIGISIGSIHKILGKRDRNEYIYYIRDCGLKFDAIELMIDDIQNFNLSDESIKYLDTLKSVSIHLPKQHLFDDFGRILKQYDFKYWVMHSDINYFDEYLKDKILIENLDAETLDKIPTNYFNDLLQVYNINFDISHELSKNLELTKFNLAMYRDRIRQIHISGYNGRCHQPMYYGDLLEISESLKRNNLIDIPIIMEYSFEDFDELKVEYNYIMDVLYE